MASTNKTTNFELPQWVSTDKPTFEGDLNSAFLTIDNTMESNKTTAETGNANANNALEKIGNLTLLETTVKDNLVNAINEIVSGGTTPSEIGDLQDLTTSAKNNLVSAINEVDASTELNKNNIGTLSSLTTTAKNNLVGAINEVNETAQELTTDNVNIWEQVNSLQEQITPLVENYNRLSEQIGTLSSLTTTAKNNLVSAINDVNANKADLLNMSKPHGTIQSTELNWTGQTEKPTYTIGSINYIMTNNQLLLYGRVSGNFATDGHASNITFTNPLPSFDVTVIGTGVVTAIYEDGSVITSSLQVDKDDTMISVDGGVQLKTGVKTLVYDFFPIPITNLE